MTPRPDSCPAALPRLETLGLAHNRLSHLGDLAPLKGCRRLARLDLSGNPVAKAPGYRLYLIALLPALKLLDFARVRDAERAASAAAFPDESALAAAATGAVSLTEAAAEARAEAKAAAGPTPRQLMALRAAIAAAATLDEVARLEKALTTGVLPADLQLEEGGEAMET